MARLTVAERILIHLFQYHRQRTEYESPDDVSQQGIARAVGISRAHAALELKKLKDRGQVEERTSHVRGASSRRRVYFLTRPGEERARGIREGALGMEVQWFDLEGKPRGGPVKEMLETLRGVRGRDLKVIEAVHTGATLDLRSLFPQPRGKPGALMLGREIEMGRLGDWLADAKVRLVSIVGIAGMGKTTLARSLAEGQPRSVLWLRLFPGDSPRGLLPHLAACLESLGRPALKSALRNGMPYGSEALALLGQEAQGCLVVLDDFAATRENYALLGALLDVGAEMKVIATSREHLAFHHWPLLAGAGALEELTLGGIEPSAARELLKANGLKLKEAQFEQIYRVTQGHPLGLQLLGSPVLSRPYTSLDDFLADEILQGLTAGQENILRALSVHHFPVGSDALADLSVVELRTLLRRSLLVQEGSDYLVHDLVRGFFNVRLGGEERRRLEEAAARYLLDHGRPDVAVPHLIQGGHAAEASELLAGAHGSPDDWSVREDDWELLGALTPPRACTAQFLLARAHLADRLGRWADAEADLRAMPPSPFLFEARLLQGRLASKAGRLAEAREAFGEATALGRGEAERGLAAQALLGLAIVESRDGHRREARRLLEEGLRAAQGPGGETTRGRIAMELAFLDLGARRYEQALGTLQAARDLLRGSPVELAKVYNNLGWAYTCLGRRQEATSALRESVRLADQTGQLRIKGYALCSDAENHLRGGDLARATALCLSSLEVCQRIGDKSLLSWAHATLGQVHARRAQMEKAEENLLRALEFARDAGDRPTEVERYRDLEEFYRSRGDSRRAREFADQAERLIEDA